MYHDQRYNTSLENKCHSSPCSHLCLLVPGGHHCACPDNTAPISHRSTAEVICDAGKCLILLSFLLLVLHITGFTEDLFGTLSGRSRKTLGL